MEDPYVLKRFLDAQNWSGTYETVVSELRTGRKMGHWMWFIFPNIQGLGSSGMARRYAVASREEARAYHEHPLLGARLRECTRLVLDVEGRRIEQIFGYPDDLKFRS